jgi:hypothetical protein
LATAPRNTLPNRCRINDVEQTETGARTTALLAPLPGNFGGEGGSQSMLRKRNRVGPKWRGRVAPKTKIAWVQGGVAAMAPKTKIMSVQPWPKKEGRNSLSEDFSGEGLGVNQCWTNGNACPGNSLSEDFMGEGSPSKLNTRKRVPRQQPLGRRWPIGTKHTETRARQQPLGRLDPVLPSTRKCVPGNSLSEDFSGEGLGVNGC